LHDTDRYVDWLADELSSGRIGLVAPTSDYVVFATAMALERAGMPAPTGVPDLESAWRCLHKPRFGEVMAEIGFPTVEYRTPTSPEQAFEDADELGYPLIIKPRSHVGIGLFRGAIISDRADLAARFRAAPTGHASASAAVLDPDLAWPFLQQFLPLERAEVVSISGCLGCDGSVMAIGQSRKLAQWPPGVGIGSMFEHMPLSDVADRAIAAVRATLGSGLFEIEMCVDRATGEAWPIDLNPRAYGQITLEVARGNDLPALWYELATGTKLSERAPKSPLPELWEAGLTYYPGAIAGVLTGPDRRARAARFVGAYRRPSVGSIFEWRDPMPSLVLAFTMLRNPTTVIRPFLPSGLRRPSGMG
jgi:predicted ATP-grasp superfamily ATP-dependent carboligase